MIGCGSNFLSHKKKPDKKSRYFNLPSYPAIVSKRTSCPPMSDSDYTIHFFSCQSVSYSSDVFKFPHTSQIAQIPKKP